MTLRNGHNFVEITKVFEQLFDRFLNIRPEYNQRLILSRVSVKIGVYHDSRLFRPLHTSMVAIGTTSHLQFSRPHQQPIVSIKEIIKRVFFSVVRLRTLPERHDR